MNGMFLLCLVLCFGFGVYWFYVRNLERAVKLAAATAAPCYCGGLYDCEDCGNDTCNCVCDKDGAPQTNHGVMA